MIGTFIAKKSIVNTFDALNRHDLPKFMSVWRDDGEFIYPGDIYVSGIFKGKNGVEEWFRGFMEQFPEIWFEIQDICVKNIFDLIGNNVIAVHWNLHLKNRKGWVSQNNGVTLVSIKAGKAFRAEDFLFDLGEQFKRSWSVA